MTERARCRRRAKAYRLYRLVLKTPELSEKEIDEMRGHIILLAQTICEHVWGKKFY